MHEVRIKNCFSTPYSGRCNNWWYFKITSEVLTCTWINTCINNSKISTGIWIKKDWGRFMNLEITVLTQLSSFCIVRYIFFSCKTYVYLALVLRLHSSWSARKDHIHRHPVYPPSSTENKKNQHISVCTLFHLNEFWFMVYIHVWMNILKSSTSSLAANPSARFTVKKESYKIINT